MAQVPIVIIDPSPGARARASEALGAERDFVVVAAVSRADEVPASTLGVGTGGVVVVRVLSQACPASTAREVCSTMPRSRVVVIGRPGDESHATSTLLAGADGFADVRDGPAALVPAVRAVSRGDAYLCPAAATALVARWRRERESGALAADAHPELSPRESEVLAALARGRSNQGIASDLGISTNTVKHHVAAVMTKLGAENRAGAVAAGMRLGLVPA